MLSRQKEKDKVEKEEDSIHLDAAANVQSFMFEISTKFMNAFNKINYWVDVMLASSKRIKILSLFKINSSIASSPK